MHVDTAPAWRGGQRRFWLTVLRLRAQGRAGHGELRRRASEGTDLYPFAPRMAMDLEAACQLLRLMRELQPDIVHTYDRPGIAMTALALSLGAPDPFRCCRPCRHTAWKEHPLATAIPEGEVLHLYIGVHQSVLADDGVPADRTTIIHDGVDLTHVSASPLIDLRAEFWLPHNAPLVGNAADLVPHRGQRYPIDPAGLVVRHVADARFLIIGDGELSGML